MEDALDDAELLASVSASVLLDFRSSPFVTANPSVFLNLDWVHLAHLRAFLRDRRPAIASLASVPVKTEASEASVPIRSAVQVKLEDSGAGIPLFQSTSASAAIRTRRLLEDDIEVFEILSSSDELEVEEVLKPSGASSDPPEPSAPLESDSDAEPEHSCPEILSDTVWYDTDIKSKAIDGPAPINRQTKVMRVEYLDDVPSNFPVPRIPTAYILDLRSPKFNFMSNNTNELLCLDTLILDKNQESWATSSGGGDHQPACLLFDGTRVKCRRSRHKCNGCYRCSELDVALVNVTRYELDPASRAQVISAGIATRMVAGDSPEKLAATFYAVIHS
ncbi:hypothetical protein B0H17DRAFT_1206046 [Mycena rosella]|uniref:Uncharacterized protein n=1 Tax=Mycena rosella TaxID=1033263 RepID=A0AAD7D5T3_MYCRO|nr:hypothetical protein B0H17DRAFT_1206046 [Mycena rosella]